ncbi:MAG TPA: hypothetical protein VL096_20930, partial [Pirellulaceae bacterium]|nr:hypothetical protein [Pirellulaceae bacterium]
MMHKLCYALLFWCVSLSLVAAQEAEPPAPAIKADGPLPWQKEKGEKGQPAKEVPPREMLRLRGMDDSVFEALFDGRDLIEDENETLNRLMFNLPRFEPEFWDKWCQKEVPWAELIAKPAEHRLQCFVLAGRAKQVERITILKDLVPLYEFTHYYRVTLEVAGHAGPIVVCTRQIPHLWKEATQLDERVAIQAMFLKSGEAKDDQTPLYFGAARVAWYPDKPNPAFGITADQVWLADHGMDIALWDEVRPTNGEKILASESECFYQLLHVLKDATPAQFKTLPAQAFDLGAMLSTPEKLHGQAYHFLGTVRRIQKVNVPESYRQRLGIDHYYMVDVSIPL